jgi:protein-tyrosine phosphatase
VREVIPGTLWVGDAGDLRKPAALEQAGVRAVVQVALSEPIPQLSRELLVAHIPLLDGPGNSSSMIAAALDMVVSLIRSCTPTLICCSGGMSRSPAIAAGALAIANGIDLSEALQRIIENRPHDLSHAVWDSVCKDVQAREDRVV